MFKLSRYQKDHRYFCGNRYEKYSIKKLKVGAASVLVGTGFLFGYNLDQVSANEQNTETTTIVTSKDGDGAQSTDKLNLTTEPKQEKAPEVGTGTPKSETKEEAVSATSPQVAETNETPSTKEIPAIKETPATKEVPENKANKVDKEIVNSSMLRDKLADLEAQLERIRGNKKQASQIQNAEKLVAEAKQYLEALDITQKEVDAKAKEISSLTTILKSIKAEEVTKENKNKDSRNGKKMEEGTGFRTGTAATTSTTTGISADVKDTTENPAVTRPPYTERKVAEGLAKQIAWLDFSDLNSWSNVDIENGNVYLKEGSIYEKEIMPNYHIKLKVKSLKPFQATEIYRKRMEANNATADEKATFNPNATNGLINRTDNTRVRITAQAQDQWSEIRDNGIDTSGRKTSIEAETYGANIGIQFEVSGTYKGNPVRPAVVMTDAESANRGEIITFTTNGSGWQQIIDLEKNRADARRYQPLNYYTEAYKQLPDSQGNDINATAIYNVGNGNKIVPKFFTNPDQETGGLGSGVFGPGITARSYSVPVVMTKNATEVGMYVFSTGSQAAMIGVLPLDEGDAPASYGEATHAMNTKDGLSGIVVKQPYLGSERPDADTNTPKNWHGDDDTDAADEGINQLLPDSLKGSEGNIIKANVSSAGYYTLSIQAHTGGAEKAYIRSWIDFNNNGKFDSDEASDIAEITQDGDIKLHFKNKTQKDAGQLLQAGTRVRIATSRDEIEKPTGLAFSGEVEDFNAKITHPPKGDKQTTIGEMKETQRTTVHFTPKGKNIYAKDDVNAEIDTTVNPVYINNKTGEKITLSNENTYTVKGQGTYKFTPNGPDVDVEFTPAKGFVGKAHGITIRRQDTNRTTTDWGTNDDVVEPNVNDVLNTMDGLYIPEVRIPTVEPTPNNAESRNIQGFAQKGKPTFNVETSDTPVTASAKHPARLFDPRTNTLADSAIVDALDSNNNKVGTYKIAPETGEVTFTPNIDYRGEVQPVKVSVPVVVAHDKDDNDVTVTKEATYTPRIIPVAPTAEASTTRDVQGKAQVSRIVFDTVEENADKNQTVNFDRSPEVGTDGEHVELDKETLTLVNASGAETNTVTTDQGEYVLDKVSKTITFTPKKTFVGQATAVRVQIKDANGTKVETMYTPTVIEVTPTGKDSATSGPQGLTQKSPIVFNQREEEDGKTLNFDTGHERVALKPETLTLLNGTDKVKSITVPNVGTYELVDNAITFTPAPAYHGTAEGVNVQVADENGNVVTKKYVPTVTELAVTPGDKTTKNIQGETQEGTPTFTIPAESTNATVTSRKLVDPADQTEKDSVTVAGKGTFTIDGNGKVTFTPVPTYKEDVPPITVKATVTVTNAKNESATITSTASYKPIIVPAEIDKAPATSTNLQGLVQTGTPTFTPKTVDVDGVQKTISVQANSYKLVKDGVESESLPAYKAGTSEQIGTYTINPQNGTVTFTPTDKTYTGVVAPVDVQATGSNGVKVQTTYTPTITPVTPTKEPSATTDVQGKKQVSRIVLDTVETDADKDKTVNFNKGSETGANGERVELDASTLTLLDGTNEVTSLTTSDGKYELDKANKTITFTPNKNFVGPATPVKVQIKDVNGTKVETTYTPTVTDVTMTSVDKESSAPQGKTQTGTPTFTVSTPEVRITGYKLLNPTGNTPVEGNEIEVPDQGTYRINPTTGEVTFIPKPGFTGPATGITVQATDENGETKDAKYTPTVTALTITPQPVTTTNIQGETQEGTPTFPVPAESNNVTVTSRKLVDPANQTEKDRVTVEGKGTFTIDGNGKVTFTPLPTYKGDVDPITVKATVTITNDKNESTTIPSTTTYKPIIVSAEIDKEPATSTNLQGLVQTGTPAFKSKTVYVDGTPKTITVQPNSYKLVNGGAESNTLPAYKAGTTEQIGTYTIDSATGQVTFTPSDKTYSGEVAPVSVQATGSNGVKVETTYTPIITPVTPTAEASATSDVQGKKQTSSIVLDTPENSADKDKTVNFNKGSQVGANGEHVELDASTLTLLDGNNEVTSLTTNDGEYVLDKASKTITFTPKKTFVGTATAVRVQIKDTNGTKVETTYTPTVTDITMKGAPATTSAPQGQTQTGTPTFTISSPEVSITGYKLLNPNGNTPVEGNEIEVPTEGTYRINPTTGQVTFIPKPGFTGPATGISVQATDGNGETAEAKYTPTVNALTVTPEGKTTTNIQGVTQEETPTFTIPTESNNATVTSRKLVDPADQTEKDSVTVAGKGTFTIDVNGKVIFTPEPTFKGEIDPITVKATVTVTNAKNESATITSTATYKPVIVPAEIDKAPATSTNLQGLVQTGTPTFTPKTVEVNGVQKTISVEPNSYKLVKDGVASDSLPAYKAGTTETIGTYTINPATGVVTFTPTDKTYTGAVDPVSVQATGSNGVKVQTTYTPSITPVTPTKEPSATSDVQGKKQVSTIVLDTVETDADKDKTVNFNKGSETGANGERVELDPNTLTLLNDAGVEVPTLTTDDGEYVLDKTNRTITFTPKKTFTGPAKAVKVQIKDVNGTKVETTYTPTVTDVTMSSVDKTSEALQGKTQTGTPEFSISTPSVRITEYKLVDPTNNTPVEEVEVANQGTYSIDKATGEVTFVPKPGFTGPTTGITVRATDENGETKDATYTPSVTPLKVTPENKSTTNIQGLPQEATPTFKLPKGVTNAVVTERKLIDPITKALTNSVSVDGKGTFTINANGKVTFTPVPSYVGDVPAIEVQGTITVLNDNNDSTTMTSKASYKPIIVPIELEKTPAESTNVQGLVQKGTPTFTPQSVDVNGVEKTVTVKPNSYKLVKDGTETDTISAYKKDTQEVIGKYTIDPQTGEVTFTPTDKTYTGEVEPATVQVTGSNNVKVQTTYTPIIKPVRPVGTNAGSEGIQGAVQEGTPTFKSGNENIPMTVSATNPAKLVDPTTNQPIEATEIDAKNTAGEKVGKYTIDPATGKVTFTPEPGFSGTPVPATVQAKDGNGTPTTATYTPVVKAAVPSGDNQVTSDIQGAKQTVTPVFTPGKNTVNNQEVSVPFEATSKAKLIDPSKTGDEREVTTLVVENQGTYTIDDNGLVTFTPLPTFKGEATAVSIVRKDKNGTPATATFKPSVVGVTPSATAATTTKVQGSPQESEVTFTPGKATIGTAEKSVPMDPTAYKLLGGQEGKTPLDTVPAMSEDGTKEVGTYTIKVVDGKPVVTFTPTDKTYAGKLKPVTVQGKDTNGTEATTTYTPVITPIVPTSENGTSSGPQGVEQTGSVTFKPGKEPGTENTPVAIDKTKMTLLGTDGNPVESLTVSKDGKVIGTYTLVKDPSGVPTGEVKFTPTDKSFVGEVPAATVQVKDANGTPTTATYTPTLTEVNPTSKPSETTGFQGLPQTSRVVLDEKDEADNTTVNFDKGNDKVSLVPSTLTLVNADGAKVTSVTVPNEGTYELNNGVITFTPLPTFHGKASGVSVQAEDVNGKVAKTTYTPTVTEVRPVGTNAGSEGIQGAVQEGTPTFKSGNENIPMTVSATNPAKLVDPTTNQPIEATEIDAKNTAGEKVGKYTIDPATGKVTFTPEPGFSGTPVPATVQAKDGNGTPTTATYTPVVKAAVPSGDNQVTSDIQGAKQTVTPVFTPGKNTVNNQEVSVPFEATSKAKLIDPSKTGDEREVTRLVVENQGTYTIDDNGVVTFTPLPTFKGEATAVSIVRKDKNGTPATATFKPSVVGVTPSATEATTTKVQGSPQESEVTFTPGKATIGTAEKSVPMDPTAYKLLGGQEGKTPLDTVPAMSEDGTKEVGTYTIKVVEGKPVVTFTPTDKTYAGKLKPVTVQGKDTNGTEATTTYTPVITPIVPTAENGTSEGPQGVEQTGSVTFKPGKEPGTENTPVAIDKTKMTLLGGTDGTTPVESLTVSKDGKEIGTYTLVKDSSGVPTGEVKFTPTDKSYVGEVPPATVQVKDANGTPATATYTPTFTEVNPTGKDSATTGLQGFAQKSPIIFNQKDEEDKTTVNFDTGHEKVTFKEDTLTLVNAAGDKVTTVTVPDVGTYELKDGVITFTSLKTFKGETTGVTVQVEDANGKIVKQKYVPNVVEVLPTGTDTTSTGLQGKVQTGTPVFTPGAPEVPMDDESPATFEDGNITKTVDKVGTYTVAKDGTVTFTPDKAFSGEAPEVTVKRVDKNGTSVTAKYKPTVTKVTPTGTDTTSTGLQGKVQTGTPVFTPGSPEVPMDDEVAATFDNGQISKKVDKVGTYTVAKDGTVTFTPDKEFVGEAPEVTVKRVDKNGTSVTAKYKPTVTKVTPTGTDTTSTGLQGKVQTGTPVFTPGTPEVPMDDESPATFEDGNITKTIDKVGTFTVAKDGTVTFTPNKEFVGEAPEVTIKRVDKNGTSVTAKYKPIVAKVLPSGESSETEGAKGKPQTSTVVFDKKDEDKSTVNFNKGDETVSLNPSTLTLVDKNGNPSTEVKVPDEGTYTLANNVITFTPEKDFAGKATGVTVQVKDINGTSIEKTYTPTVRAVTTFVDPSGNPITVDKNNKPVESEVDGSKQPTKDIYGYKFVRTETDNKGNTKHIYEQAEGKSVKVTYVSTTGETLSDSQTVETKDKFIGTDYDASIEALKLERIEKDGKVYLLKERKADSASENGKLSDKEQTVTYVYEEVQEPASNQKYGNVVVVYKDKFGRPISGTTESGKEVASTVIDTPNSPINTKYDTTDHKPQTITTKDGKKYKLIKVLKTSDAEKSGVKARTSVITYVYEMLGNTAEYPEAHIGLVLVNYLDEEGNPISGKTPEGKVVPNMVVDTEADLVGKEYDTTDHKVSTIIVENGDVYELLKVSEASVEKGKLTEGATNVNYIYHKVVTTFVDENGKEIKSPEKGRTDKKDIPEYTFKETKKDANGNTVHVYTKKSSSTPVTPTPSKEKETLFVDENGKPLQPAKKGQHPQDKIPGYEFVGTETDANGNVRHLYRKIQSTIPVEPTQPTAPTVPEQPAQPEVPTSPAQSIQPTEVKEVEAKRELPNTGTEDHASLAALGLLGALSGFGLVARKKKED